jgi:ribonuclease P protein component
MINEKNLSAEQSFEGKKARIPQKDVYQERKKNTERPKKKGKKEFNSLSREKKTLRKGYQFRRVFRTGTAFRGVSFRAVYSENTLGYIRLGFSLSAKSGNAVMRNLIRRRIKNLREKYVRRVGADIVILPQGKLENAKWPDIRDDFNTLMKDIEKTIAEKTE